ncbi:hypothetical protein J2S28_005023 [Rhizobium sp. SLBN-94]|jgi:hypothetical protein|nr:hypothetical protein [Rhizobium sp. SLBN-94]MDP9791247.1 hypothetical protein [Agrobacterium tumefaciens]CUX55690.1 conserved exported hypothetical protein [Agrobacterium tumefaciens str. CFBP 5621]
MKLKLALGVILGVTCTSAVAEARAQWHLYGTVPVTGDHLLENAYRSALDRCSLTSYPSYDRAGLYRGAYGSPDVRSCMYRMGFILENGEPFAYPVRKVTYLSR